VGLTPCRLLDTRGNGFGDPFGPPALATGVPARSKEEVVVRHRGCGGALVIGMLVGLLVMLNELQRQERAAAEKDRELRAAQAQLADLAATVAELAAEVA
jgi:hypothetical protein